MHVVCLVGVRFPGATYVKDTPSRSTKTVTIKSRVCKLTLVITKNYWICEWHNFLIIQLESAKAQEWATSVTKKIYVSTEDAISP